MRDFFKNEVLERTYEIFGTRQTDGMSDEDVKYLLDGLCTVSENRNYIPQEEQQKIIKACMLTDQNYRNINVRLVAGWLDQNGKKYFKEIAHTQTEAPADYKPLDGEERAKAIQTLLDAVAGVQDHFTVKPITNAEIIREKFQGPDAKPTGYKPMSAEEVYKKELHKQYVKENYDPITANALETWMPESEWIKKREGVPSV